MLNKVEIERILMKVVMINELPVGSLESIKKMKQELGRDKDIRDIELIDSFLGRGRLWKYIL